MINGNQFMRIALEVSKASHCVSVQVGAIIVKDHRIISTGYNGTPQGYLNCDDLHCESGPEHSAWSADHEIHAEMNAVIFAAKAGISIDNGTMYTTLSPCRQCLKHLRQSGIIDVYYADRYSKTTDEQHRLDRVFSIELGIGLRCLPLTNLIPLSNLS
jgi:dCMP deaminase